jgi:hypothetical protein
MTKMPDFIIIGAMKCATSTLHEQLAQQPGIFMTEPKEPFFFSNDEVWEKGLNWYASLYHEAGEHDLCGESSTHYTKLPTYPKTIGRMHTHAPDAKLIYVIRHPIDRLISHYIHDWSEKIINSPIDEAIATHPDLAAYSMYAMQIRPFLETYGPTAVLLVFFEHLLADSQKELERIAQFLGYADKMWWHNNDASNVSTKRMRRSPCRDAIVWNPISTWLRRNLIPQSMRDWVKGFWQMKHRPVLKDQQRQELEHLFDEDLAQLSQWINIDLSCRTFKHVAKVSMPNWSNNVPTPKRSLDETGS